MGCLLWFGAVDVNYRIITPLFFRQSQWNYKNTKKVERDKWVQSIVYDVQQVYQDEKEKPERLQIKWFEATKFWEACSNVLERRCRYSMRKARAAKVFELREEGDDILHARTDRADPICNPAREDAPDDFPESPGPS